VNQDSSFRLENRAGLVISVALNGARIVQISDPDGHDWLVETDRPAIDPEGPVDFTEGTRGGWDECLPSIDPEADPNAQRGDTTIADHGDFWFRDWALVEQTDLGLVLSSIPIDHPLRLRKTFRLDPVHPRLEIEVEVTNASGDDYRFLTSGHPLFAWTSAARIEVPDAGEVRSAFGEAQMGADVARWSRESIAVGDAVELARDHAVAMYKIFVRWTGITRLKLAGMRWFLELEQSPEITPWLGICVNRRSWPAGEPGDDWIALEATTSPTDSLTVATDTASARNLAPDATLRWTTEVTMKPQTLNDTEDPR
jgi:galactose mutarotase-like enzyme